MTTPLISMRRERCEICARNAAGGAAAEDESHQLQCEVRRRTFYGLPHDAVPAVEGRRGEKCELRSSCFLCGPHHVTHCTEASAPVDSDEDVDLVGIGAPICSRFDRQRQRGDKFATRRDLLAHVYVTRSSNGNEHIWLEGWSFSPTARFNAVKKRPHAWYAGPTALRHAVSDLDTEKPVERSGPLGIGDVASSQRGR